MSKQPVKVGLLIELVDSENDQYRIRLRYSFKEGGYSRPPYTRAWLTRGKKGTRHHAITIDSLVCLLESQLPSMLDELFTLEEIPAAEVLGA